MTYKNIKFSESDVMKEFEKIALDKKIIQPKIKKKASKIEISANLDVNICNLINKLSESGNFSLAEEVRSNFLEYKKAQVEDAKNELKMKKLASEVTNDMKRFYDSAHPEGSVKMDDDSESVVEDLYDSHDAIMKIVNKVNLKKKANLIKRSEDSYLEMFIRSLQSNTKGSLYEIISATNAPDSKEQSGGGGGESGSSEDGNINMLATSALNNINVLKPSMDPNIIKDYINRSLQSVSSIPKSDRFSYQLNTIIGHLNTANSNIEAYILNSASPNGSTNQAPTNTNNSNGTALQPTGENSREVQRWMVALNALKAAINKAAANLSGFNESDADEDWKTKAERYIDRLEDDYNKISNSLKNEFDDLREVGVSTKELDNFTNLSGFRNSVRKAIKDLGDIK